MQNLKNLLLKFFSAVLGALFGFVLLFATSEINYSLDFIIGFVLLGKVWMILGVLLIIAGTYSHYRKFNTPIHLPLFLISSGIIVAGMGIVGFLPIMSGS